MTALRASLRPRGLCYVRATAALVILVGAGGMPAFKPTHEMEGGLAHYGEAVW
jgi:hypothetical protein